MDKTLSECALILAPVGRDATVAAAILAESDIASKVCPDLAALVAALEDGAGFAVLADEALLTADASSLSHWLHAQPAWSDFPFVLLTRRGGSVERNPAASRHLETLGNVAFLERPFHPTTLVSLGKSALRGRRRQYEARGRLQELHDNERLFRTLADSIPTLCWMAEPDGNIFWYNKRWYDYTGSTPEQMKGWGWQSVHDPKILPEVVERWKASIASGEPFDMVFPLRGADGTFRPFLTRIVPIRDVYGRVARWFGTNTDIAAQQKNEDHLSFLMHEISHRSKNLLAVVQSMIRQIALGSADTTDFSKRLSDRLQGLASTHDQLIDNNWQSAKLRNLLVRQLSPFVTNERATDLSGPELQMNPKAAEALGLAFHELATNAAKHGALSLPGGHVEVRWQLTSQDGGEPMLKLTWQEFDGPEVRTPQKKGFGSTVLNRVVPSALSGNVALDYLPAGIVWSLECPAKEAVAV